MILSLVSVSVTSSQSYAFSLQSEIFVTSFFYAPGICICSSFRMQLNEANLLKKILKPYLHLQSVFHKHDFSLILLLFFIVLLLFFVISIINIIIIIIVILMVYFKVYSALQSVDAKLTFLLLIALNMPSNRPFLQIKLT